MRHQLIILSVLVLWVNRSLAQYPSFSIGTDLGATRNWSKGQQFTTLNHSIQLDFHLAEKEGVHVNFSYSSFGKYSNQLMAQANDPGTLPQQIRFTNAAKLRFRIFSVGWKHYLRGDPQMEKGWNLYSKAGFGLMMGLVQNTYNRTVDTALYKVPLKQGSANFKRLTLDMALGWEKCLGADFYFYTEARVSVPSTGYPSPYLLVNDKAPFPALLCGGLRILF